MAAIVEALTDSQLFTEMERENRELRDQNAAFSDNLVETDRQLSRELQRLTKEKLDLERKLIDQESQQLRAQANEEKIQHLERSLEVKSKIGEKLERDIVSLKMSHQEEVRTLEADLERSRETNQQNAKLLDEKLQQLRNHQNEFSQKEQRIERLTASNELLEREILKVQQENIHLNEANRKNGHMITE